VASPFLSCRQGAQIRQRQLHNYLPFVICDMFWLIGCCRCFISLFLPCVWPVICSKNDYIFVNWMFCCRQAVSYERLRRSFKTSAVQRSRRLSGHAFLARGVRSTSRNEYGNHLLPGEGWTRSPAASPQVSARPRTRKGQTQGKPKTGSILQTLLYFDTSTKVKIIFAPARLISIDFRSPRHHVLNRSSKDEPPLWNLV